MYRFKAQIAEDGSREAIARYCQDLQRRSGTFFALKKQFMTYSELP